MFTSLLVISFTLASQVGAGDSRYQPLTPIQPTTPAAGASSNSGALPSRIAPMNSAAAPPATAAPRNTTPPNSNPYAPTRPSGAGSAQPISPYNSGGTPANMGQSQPPPGYPGQTIFPGEDSTASQQPPSKSAVLMQAMLSVPRNSQLRGEPVRLLEVVSTGRTRNEQTQRVEAYWDLCSSVADYYLSVREQEELQSLTSAASGQSAALQEVAKELTVRCDTSLRAARATQFRLAGFIGRGPSNLPLPADMPHCGSYTSRYSQVFAGRSSVEAQGLSELLPLRYAELNDAAVGVARDEDWFKGINARNQNTDAAGTLQALKLLALDRRAFVQIARDYNRRIARYTELATPRQVSPERLTSMLIKRPGSSTANRSAVPAPPPTRTSSGVENAPPRTFVNQADWLPADPKAMTGAVKQDRAVQPASATQAEKGSERSVLVQPQ